MRATFIKAAENVIEQKHKEIEEKNAKCYFCEVPVAGIEYKVTQKKAIDLFLKMNPQWLSFGKIFDNKARLCNQGYCLAAHYENWRVDYFGLNSPRGVRSARVGIDRTEQAEGKAEQFLDAANTPMESDGHEEGKIEDLLRRTGASLASSLIENGEEAEAADGDSIAEAKGEADVQLEVPPLKIVTEDEDKAQQSLHDFDRALKQRQEALQAMANRSSTLDRGSQDMSAKLRRNREERLKVARRLQEIREKQPELDMRKLEREKEVMLERKRDLYEQILQARMEKEEAQRKVDRLDLQQRIALMKIEEYSRLRKEDETALEEREKSRDRLKADLEPVLKHMPRVTEARKILEGSLDGGREEENSAAITQELQHALREAYTQQQEEMLERRKQLTAGRFELESRLGQLKDFERSLETEDNQEESEDEDSGDEPLLDDHDNALNDDEPFEAAFRLATEMGDMAQENTSKLLKRIARNREEQEWLEDYPDTDVWKVLTERVREDSDSHEQRKAEEMELQRFFETVLAKDKLKDEEAERQAHDAAARSVTNEILGEVCEAMVRASYEDLMDTKNKIIGVLDRTVVDILLGTGKFREMLRIDGSEYLTFGLINDLRRKVYVENRSCQEESGGKASFAVDISQDNCTTTLVDRAFGIGFGWNRMPEPQKDWPLPVDGVIDLNSYLEEEELEVNLPRMKVMEHAEARHWDGIYLEAAPTSPVLIPNMRGRISILQMFYRKKSGSSLLIAGLHIGRFIVWTVPHPKLERVIDHDGVEKLLPQTSPPILTSVSPELPKVDACPIIDIREGSISSFTVITMYRNGHIRVWDLNPVSVAGRRKAASHLRNMFPKDQAADFVPLVPSMVFHMNALDLSLPGLNPQKETEYMQLEEKIAFNEENKVHIRKKRAEMARSKPLAGGAKLGEAAINEHYEQPGVIFGSRKVRQPPQPGKIPTQICFHPSFTLTGRNPSIMVGTQGGDILKINMDYRVADLAAPIVNLPPFVNVEYVHPVNQPEVYLRPGEKKQKGNKVYRELFHYHKSPIVFLGVLQRTSDTIVSIDEDGHLALWKYSKEYFGGTVSFRPYHTRHLNTEFYKQIRRTGNTRPGMEEPESGDARHLRVRKRERITEEEAAPQFMARFLKGEDDDNESALHTHLRETYYPVLSKEGNGRYIEYSSTRRLPRPSSSQSGSIGSMGNNRKNEPIESQGGHLASINKKDGEVDTKGTSSAGMNTTLIPEAGGYEDAADDISVLTGDPSVNDAGSVSTDPIKITQWDEYAFDAGVSWSSQYVEIVTFRTAVVDIEHPVKQSEDGEEVYFCLTYREDNPLSKDMAGVDPYTDYIMFVTLSLRNMQFKLPYPKFSLKRGEELFQFQVGPVNEETLSRVLFVHTSAGTRLFSLESGQEIFTYGNRKDQGHFPYQSSLLGFESRLMALCPSQRAIAIGGPDDSRIEINFFYHLMDGVDEELPESLELHPRPLNDYIRYKDSLLSSAERSQLSQPESFLKTLSTRSVMVNPVEPDQDRIDARVEAKRAVDYVWEAFLVAIERRGDAARRNAVAADVYGSNIGLGRVHPTHWPLRRVERSFRYATFDISKVVEQHDDSDEDSQGASQEGGAPSTLQAHVQAQSPATVSKSAPEELAGVGSSSSSSSRSGVPSDVYNTVRNTETLDAFSVWEGGSNFQLPEDWKLDPTKDSFLNALLFTKVGDSVPKPVPSADGASGADAVTGTGAGDSPTHPPPTINEGS